MSNMSNAFRKVRLPDLPVLMPCKLCGSRAELWQRWAREDIWSSFCCCTNIEDVDGEPCHFHLPHSEAFYRERRIDAIKYWNLIMGERKR